MPRRLTCRSGRHAWTDENTKLYPDGRLRCSLCVLEKARAWNHANSSKRLESNRRWAAANRERSRAHTRKWDSANKERHLARNRKWRALHPEKDRARSRSWNSAHPEDRRARNRRRIARKLSQLGFWPIPEREWISFLYEVDPHCYYCRSPLLGVYQVEHRIPLARPELCPLGRKLHEPWNVRLSCPSCNRKKRDKTPEEFASTTQLSPKE